MRLRRCHWCKGSGYLECHICDGSGDSCMHCLCGVAPCCVRGGRGHAYAQWVMEGMASGRDPLPSRSRTRIHRAVSATEAAGLGGWRDIETVVVTMVDGRRRWLTERASALVAAGVLADDGDVDQVTGRRWYRHVDTKPHYASKEA